MRSTGSMSACRTQPLWWRVPRSRPPSSPCGCASTMRRRKLPIVLRLASSTCCIWLALARCRFPSCPTLKSAMPSAIPFVLWARHPGLSALQPGDKVGLRGPFGRGWPLQEMGGCDVVLVTGGLGCAPVVSVIHYVLRRRERFGKLVIIQGVKTRRGPDLARAIRPLGHAARYASNRGGEPGRGTVALACRARDRTVQPGQFQPGARGGDDVRTGRHDAHRRGKPADARPSRIAAVYEHGAQHAVCGRPLRPLPVRRCLRLSRRSGVQLGKVKSLLAHRGY